MYSNEYVRINSWYTDRLLTRKWDGGVHEYVANLIERELFVEDGWLAPPLFYPNAPENSE